MNEAAAREGTSALPAGGKIAAATFEQVIAHRLGARRSDVLVGPQHGLDAGVLDIGDGRVMAVTTDPFFVMPHYGWQRAAWFAVHIVASDAATSGLAPSHCAIDLNLPLDFGDDDLDALWTGIDRTCREIGLAVVTGHTGRYQGCTFPMIGGATVMAVGDRASYLTPGMARPGDLIVVTKGAAIETTGMFGATFPAKLATELGHELAAAAGALFEQMSVVRDAALAVGVGIRDHGVTSLHDATERGIRNGLVEIAQASGNGLLVDEAAIIVRPEVRAVCDLLAIDPLDASSEGTLLLTCRPHRAGAVIERLAGGGIAATVVGEIEPRSAGVRAVRAGRTIPLSAPEIDPFWPAFELALQEWKTT